MLSWSVELELENGFVINSFADPNNKVAYISEAKVYDTNEIGYSHYWNTKCKVKLTF